MVAFVAAHLLPLAGSRPRVFTDTPVYFAQAHAGPLSRSMWIGMRPPLTGLFFWACGCDKTAIIVVQAVVAGVCWAVLALELAPLVSSRAARVLLTLGLLVASLTQLGMWDGTVLSDGLSLSLTALAVATGVRYARRRSRGALAALGATIAAAALSRDLNGLIGLAAAAGALLVAVIVRRNRADVIRAAAVVVVIILATTMLQVASRRSRVVLVDEVMLRALPSPTMFDFYRAHGMPAEGLAAYRPEVAQPSPLRRRLHAFYRGYGVPAEWLRVYSMPPDRQERFMHDPRLLPLWRWLYTNGWKVKAEWALTHPAQTVLEPLVTPNALTSQPEYAPPGFWSLRAVFAVACLIRLGLIALSVVLLGGCVLLWRRRRAVCVASLSMLALTSVTLILAWNGEAMEPVRHGLVGDALFLTAGVLGLAGLLDIWLDGRRRLVRTAFRADAGERRTMKIARFSRTARSGL